MRDGRESRPKKLLEEKIARAGDVTSKLTKGRYRSVA